MRAGEKRRTREEVCSLFEILARLGTNRHVLAKDLNVHSRTVYRWNHGTGVPPKWMPFVLEWLNSPEHLSILGRPNHPITEEEVAAPPDRWYQGEEE